MQVQQRQHLGHFGRTPHVRRQNLTDEALPLALFIAPAIIYPRRAQLHRARA
jgi:hypothetical protein